jgi:ABC-type transport system substrate-binding protein
MGWCNDAASKAIIAANNTLDRAERIKQYAIVQQEFSKDMVSLPLFNRVEAAAANKKLVNFKPNPTETYTYNIEDWELPGKTPQCLASPKSLRRYTPWLKVPLWPQCCRFAQRQDGNQPRLRLSSRWFHQIAQVGDGATNADVDVKAGDMVWSTAGEAVKLAKDVEVTDATGATVKWDGSSPLKLKQLTVSFEMKPGMKWQDGSPVTKADYELGHKTTCDKDSGAT